MPTVTQAQIPDLGWTTFPPTAADAKRLAAYERNQELFDPPDDKRDKYSYLGALLKGTGSRRKIEMLADYPGVITRVCADLLCGEPPVIQVAGGGDDQTLLTQICQANDFSTLLYESQLAASPLGDTVLRVRFGNRHPYDDQGEVVIEEISPEQYFVDLDPDNVRRVLAQHVAWVRCVGKQHYLRVETHLPGWVFQRAYRIKAADGISGSYKVLDEVDLSDLYSEQQLAQEVQRAVPTGVAVPLLFHIPNYRTGKRYWGISDYHKLEPIFDGINNRLSKIDQYLDRHSAPKLVTPPGLLGPDGKVNAQALETIIASNPEVGKFLPRYVTWDGQMNSSFQELEVYVDLVFKVSEIAPAVFGLDKAGSIESGRAMRMRFVRTEAKINRKRTHYDRVVKRALAAAIALHKFWVENKTADTTPEIEILWQDGIPQDYAAAVTSEAERAQNNLTSIHSAIKRIDGCSDSAADVEIARIIAEQSQLPQLRPKQAETTASKVDPPPAVETSPAPAGRSNTPADAEQGDP